MSQFLEATKDEKGEDGKVTARAKKARIALAIGATHDYPETLGQKLYRKSK